MIGAHNQVAVVGGYRGRPSSSSGTAVHIHVNQAIGSERFDQDHCALRTGSWDTSTNLQVDVGGSGRIQGAGGFGGNGANGATNGNQGGAGTSGLGVEYSPTQVNIASGGIISGGFGGGGGGGGGGAAGGQGAAIRRSNGGITVNINDPSNVLNGRGSTTATTVQ